MKQLPFFALVMLSGLFYGAGCEEKSAETKNTENDPGKIVLAKLYEEYRFGQIERCTYEGRIVYHAGINAMDAGTQVYDSAGKVIGTCNYMARLVDPPCEKLSDCEVLYRCDNHMTGEPAVNKLGLPDSSSKK